MLPDGREGLEFEVATRRRRTGWVVLGQLLDFGIRGASGGIEGVRGRWSRNWCQVSGTSVEAVNASQVAEREWDAEVPASAR